MDIPFASQQVVVRLWAVASALIVGLLVVLAGGSLMLAASLEEAYDWLWHYPVTGYFGLGSVLLVWLIYIGSLILLLGYEDTEWRRIVVILLFLACCGFLCFLLWNIGLPFHFNGMQSVM